MTGAVRWLKKQLDHICRKCTLHAVLHSAIIGDVNAFHWFQYSLMMSGQDCRKKFHGLSQTWLYSFDHFVDIHRHLYRHKGVRCLQIHTHG